MLKKRRYSILLSLIAVLIFFSVFFASAAPLTGTLTPISVGTPTASHQEPAISGNYIVWRDDRTGSNNIYLYDISTGVERQLTTGTANKINPAISGHYIVWQDRQFGPVNGYDIVLYDINTDSSVRIVNRSGDQTFPSVDGDLVVWQDRRNGVNSDIYLYSISAGTETQVSHASGDQIKPRVSGNLIVWENDTFYPGMVSVYDYAGNRTPFLPIFFDGTEDQTGAAIRNNQLVWSDNRPDAAWYRIYTEDITTGEIQSITPDDHDHILPDVDGTRVVWIEDGDIYLNDTAIPESETMVTQSFGATSKDSLRISCDRMVWREYDGSDDMIYLFTLGNTETCPVADFTISPSQSGAVPFTVSFTDTSTNPPGNPISHWTWDFGEGGSSHLQDPDWTYNLPGNYDVRLILDNVLCRSETDVGPGYRINAGAAPVAGVSASKTSGLIPLEVTFTDTSLSATSWNWSFGDGFYADTNPASHTYTDGGTYTIRLNASNSWGYSGAQTTVQVLTGANENTDTTINGIAITTPFGSPFLTYDSVQLPGPVNKGDILICISPQLSDHGWQNITFISNDGIGFIADGTLIKGNISGVIFQNKEIIPVGFSKSTGSQSSINFTMNLNTFPIGGTMNSQVWEGVLDSDLDNFQLIAHGGGWSHILGTAYTIKNTKTHLSPEGPARIHMSVNATWVSANQGRDHTYLIRIGEDGMGEVLATRFLYTDPVKNLDYFEADSPRGLCTFGLSQLSGSGNPLQLITLSVASHVSSSDNTVSDGPPPNAGVSGGKATAPAAEQNVNPPHALAPPDTGQTEKIYSNAQGVITQATLLQSTDQQAQLSIGLGVVAKDAAGAPLSLVTVTALPEENVPPVPSSASYTFARIAYDFGPDGATFSPAITLTFSYPPWAQWGQEYTIKSFDHESNTWQDLPTSYDAGTGKLTTTISHFCCVALFAKPMASANPPPKTITPQPILRQAPPDIPAPPPGTALNIFVSMMTWVTELVIKNMYIVVIVIILGIAYGMKRWKYPGSEL